MNLENALASALAFSNNDETTRGVYSPCGGFELKWDASEVCFRWDRGDESRCLEARDFFFLPQDGYAIIES